MEDKKNLKLNNTENLPEVPRDENGKIDIDKISIGKDEKGRIIVPDEILLKYYKELPEGTTNESRNKWVYNGGLLNKATKEVQKMGAEALNAKKAQRRTFAEVIEEMLVNPASDRAIEELELRPDATNLDMIIAAALKQANKGNVKAMDFLRDTIGQKPTESINATVESITPEDKALLDRVAARLKNDNS